VGRYAASVLVELDGRRPCSERPWLITRSITAIHDAASSSVM
jgi:hypothetical protein